MIRIMLSEGYDEYKLTVKGHAEYNPGNDILCSSVSTIVSMISLYINKYAKDMIIYKNIIEEGRAEIHFAGDAASLMEAVKLTLKQLAKQYPEYVKIKAYLM